MHSVMLMGWIDQKTMRVVMRNMMLILPAVIAAGVAFGAEESDRQAQGRPNIIFFLADDMGMGDTSVYQDWSKNPDDAQLHTPAMDRLAKEGVRFTDAHSPSSRCSPSRYALMTGRYCWRTRLKQFVLFGVQCDPLIERDRLTLPEFLRKNGYQTGLVGKWHLGLSYTSKAGTVASGWEDADLTKPIADGPMHHGFDFFYGVSRSHRTSGPPPKKNLPSQAIGPGWIEHNTIVGATGVGKQLDGSYVLKEMGVMLDKKAFEFLRPAVAAEKPFFLYFASPSNHTPYTPSVSIGGIPIVGAARNIDGSKIKNKKMQARLDFIYQNDVHIARLIAYLKETDDPRNQGKKLVENTIFIFSADNGSEHRSKQYTGPVRSHKASTYEGGHRVPFIVSWPAGGVSGGRSSDRLLSLTDMYATFAEVLGKPLPPLKGAPDYGAEDSVSQLAEMQGKSMGPRIPLFSNDHKEAGGEETRAWVAIHSHRAPQPGKWKLLLDHTWAFDQKYHPKELYNLESDQKESKNLIRNPEFKDVLDYMLEQAKLAAGDDGSSRQLEQ